MNPIRAFVPTSTHTFSHISYWFMAALWLLCSATASAQTPFTSQVDETLLRAVMPQAERFSAREGEPPVYTAWGRSAESGSETVIGYVFQTSDLPPEEIGFSGPIDVLVAMDTEATVLAVKVLNYYESFLSSRGDFLNSRGFQDQFRRKPLTDEFRVGRDVDGVSRATISSWAMTRSVYNAARQVAGAYLPDSGIASGSDSNSNALAHLEPLSWEDMVAQDLIRTLTVTLPDGTLLELSMTYMGTEVLGNLLVGFDAYSTAERAASSRFDDGQLFLVGISGNASDPFRQERLSIQQGDVHYPMPRRQTVYAGSGDDGKIAGHANYAVAMVLENSMDLSAPFTIFYDPQNGQPPASLEYQLSGVPLALALGQDVLPPGATTSASGSDVNWLRALAVAAVLALVLAAFLTKNATLRWLTLGVTFLYLGFINGGFLSVSHITNTLSLGPSMILSDLPLLLIVLFTLITTFIWGRVFCSSACPFGALQDLMTRFVPARRRRTVPQAIHDRAIYLKYAFLAVIVLMAIFYSGVSIFQYFEPFGTLFFFSTSVVLWAILLAILLASAVVERFYCRYVCPLGAALGVLSLASLSRIKRVPQCSACKVCEHACPTGAIRRQHIDFKECVRCDVCERKLIQKAGVCKHSTDALEARGVRLVY